MISLSLCMGTARVRKRHHIKKRKEKSTALVRLITSLQAHHNTRRGRLQTMAQRHGHTGNTTQRTAGQTMDEMDLSTQGNGVGEF